MASSIERLEKARDIAVEYMNQIIEEEKAKAEKAGEPEARTVREVADMFEPPYTGEEEDEGLVVAPAAERKEATPPEPVSTGPHEFAHKAEGVKVNRSKLVREYFTKHRDDSNKNLINFYAKKGIEIKPALVSTVKISMGLVTKKKRGRPAKSSGTVAVARRASLKRGLPMTACVPKALAGSKHGMKVDDILRGIKKYYNYRGKQKDEGLKNVLYQALYALSKKKSHRGWKGDVPVILHDEESCTWKLNPRAERKTA